jgi:hypothetical protein
MAPQIFAFIVSYPSSFSEKSIAVRGENGAFLGFAASTRRQILPVLLR